jgi:hypothetical protein
VYRNLYGQRPEYYMTGGLVFSPLNREYLKTLTPSESDPNAQQLVYLSRYAKVDKQIEGRTEFVVLVRRLAHPVNTYSEEFSNGVVNEVNGVKIGALADLKRAVETNRDRFHVLRFLGMEDVLILPVDAAREADHEIARRYGIPDLEHLEGP